jgi:hypothetical protein
MDHMEFLVGRAAEPEGDPCGHALMATCPPHPDISENNPHESFGGEKGTWMLQKADLSTLLDLSRRLNLDGEITPVMAWGMVLAHPRFLELTLLDFERIKGDLKGKVRCYG